ncbi:autotransporter domain-containing protein [Pontiellaceae bacterium B12227]|nr:autotransporter domain-containing protein [Pontiellaceae bacterium B12227]
MTRFLNIFAVLLGTITLASAYTNIVEDGTYQPVTNDWQVGGLEIVVGGSTSGNTLDIYNASLVSNAVSVTAGRDAGADDNTILVENAALISSGDLKIGDQGSENSLEISDGGYVENADAWVGAQTGAGNNSVSVSDSGSWIIDGKLMLNAGISNSVSVSDGGQVSADELLMNGDNIFNLHDGGFLQLKSDFDVSTSGFNWNEGGQFSMTNGTLTGLTETNGTAVLTGSRILSLYDSVLDVSGSDLTVGLNGTNTYMAIRSGTVVTSENGMIGSGEGSDNNLVYLDGAGSIWRNNGGSLDIGVGAGEGNRLVQTNGAWAFVGDVAESDLVNTTTNGGIAVASAGGASMVLNNSASVQTEGGLFLGTTSGMSGTVTVQSNSTLSAATLAIEDGSSLNLKETGAFTVAGDFKYGDDTAKFVWEDNTTLTVGGELTKATGLDGVERTLILNGGSWSPGAATVLTGVSNQLEIAAGTQLNSTDGVVSGTNNIAYVYGSGSRWDNTGTLSMIDTKNNISISGGGRVSAVDVSIGAGNSLDIHSGGTLELTTNLLDWSATENVNWNEGGNLQVTMGTFEGMTTTNIVVDGATNNAAYIGGGRHLTLNGGNWVEGADKDLVVGYGASSASLAITNGTTVHNEDAYIGWGGSGGNSVLVSDSVWHNAGGDLYVGAYRTAGTNVSATTGGQNYLTVTDGAKVFVGEGTNNVDGLLVASTNGATFNIWNGSAAIDDTLTLGLSATQTGSATIYSGGTLSVGSLDIAYAASTNNVLNLLSGGTFDIRSDFDVTTAGFNWGSNSTLSVGGELTGKTSDLSMGQDLTLDGSDAEWDASGDTLKIGADGTAGSVLSLQNGATLTSADTMIGASTNSGSHSIQMNFGSYWKSTGDLKLGSLSSGNALLIYGASTNDMDGSAYIGGTNTIGNYARIQGSNSWWNIGGGLEVGSSTGGVDNALLVYDQGTVSVGTDLIVYSSNSVELASDGAIDVDGDMTIHSNATVTGSGIITLNTAGKALNLKYGNGNISSTILFEGQGDNTVDVDGGTFFVIGSNSNQYRKFETLDLTDTMLYGYGTNDAFGTVTMSGGSIVPSADIGSDSIGTLVIPGKFTASDTRYVARINGDSGSDLLHFTHADGVDLSGLNAEVWITQAPSNLTATILSADGGFGGSTFNSNSIINGLLLYDAELMAVGDTNMDVNLTANTDQFSSSLDYAATETVRAGFGSMKNAVFTRTKQLRRNLVSTAHSIPHEAYLLSNTNAPAGAQGPGDENTIFDMHIWVQFFNGQGDYDAQGKSHGFSLNNSGTTIGADRLVGEDLTVGFNYTYARGDARTTNQDYLDTETYWIGAFGEWVSKNGLYVDALAAYGRSNYDSVRVETEGNRNYRGTSSYRGDNFGSYVDLGQYFYYKNLALSPYVGLHLLTMKSEDHIEDNEAGNSQLKVDGKTRNILESALGFKGRYRFDTGIGRFQTSGYAEWTHDFIQDDVYSTLSALGPGSANLSPVDYARIAPESDVVNAGLGLSWICTDYMEIGVGYNGRFSDNYEEHAGTLMLDVRF